MPFPLIGWAIAALVSALLSWLAWDNREKIADWFENSDGKKFLNALNEAADGAFEPYRKIVEVAHVKTSSEQLNFFTEMRARVTKTEWDMLKQCVGDMSREDPKYLNVLYVVSNTSKPDQG